MANPALKNGYISIANELVEKLATINIPGSETRILWVIWRKTWGWKEGDRKKDWDWISLSQFSKMTGIKRNNVAVLLKSLVYKRILLRQENQYKFNQNYDEWVVYKRIPVVYRNIPGGMQLHGKSGMQEHTYKRNKETNTKETAGVVSIIKAFEDIDPKNKTYYGNTTQRKACDFLISEYGLDEVLRRIPFLKKTNIMPYFPKINSPNDLKEKWMKLEDGIKSEKLKNKVNYIL